MSELDEGEAVDNSDLDLKVGRFVRKFGSMEMTLAYYAARFLLPTGTVSSRAQEAAEISVRRLGTRDLLDTIDDLGRHWLPDGGDLVHLRALMERLRKLTSYRNSLVHTPPHIAQIWRSEDPTVRVRPVQMKGRGRKPRDIEIVRDFSVKELERQTSELVAALIQTIELLNRLVFETKRPS